MRRRFQWPGGAQASNSIRTLDWVRWQSSTRERGGSCLGTCDGLSAAGNRHGGAAPEAESFGRALLRPRYLDDTEGIHQGEKLPRANVAVGPSQRQAVAAGPYDRRREGTDQLRVDVGDQVAEMVDRDDHAGDLVRRDGRLFHPRRHDIGGLRSELRGRDANRSRP